MYRELFSGVGADPAIHLRRVFHEQYDEVVLLRDIDFHSLCEHHLLPFHGKAHVAYLAERGRWWDCRNSPAPSTHSRGGRAGSGADDLPDRGRADGASGPEGRGPWLSRQEHLCMKMRGVQKPNGSMITSAVRASSRNRPPLGPRSCRSSQSEGEAAMFKKSIALVVATGEHGHRMRSRFSATRRGRYG